MGDLGPVVAAIAASILGAILAWFSARRLRSLGIGDDQATVKATLRELADVWQEKYNLERAAHEATTAELTAVKSDLALEVRLGQQCRTDLDDARSKVRALERRRGTRP